MGEPFLGWAILAVVAAGRGAEALYATANARRLLAAGAVRAKGDWTAALVAIHVLWLLGLAVERAAGGARVPVAALAVPLAVALVGVEGLRAWVLATLGRRWTIVVVVVPGEAPVARGPYRFVRHPNYSVVALEMAIVPVLLGAWVTLAATAVPAAFLLWLRIRREESAWREVAGSPLSDLPRLVPGRARGNASPPGM